LNTTKTYRSKKRDEPRFIRPATGKQFQAFFSGKPYKESPPQPGDILLKENGPTLTKMIRTARNFNRKELNAYCGKELKVLLVSIDDLWTIMSRYTWVIYGWPDARPSPVQNVLFPCLWKSMLSLYACQHLTTEGLFGVARPHLRHVFESLLIAKFCSANPSSDVYDRWIDGVDIYFTNAILKKISRPSTEEFSQLWKLLCQWSHATAFAGQAGMKFEEAKEGTVINIGLCEVFLQWSYHLIYRHMVTSTVRYYADRYTQNKRAEKARARLTRSFEKSRKYLGAGSLRLIRDFRSTWTLHSTT